MTFILIYFCIIRIECGSLRSFGIRGLFVCILRFAITVHVMRYMFYYWLMLTMFQCLDVSVFQWSKQRFFWYCSAQSNVLSDEP